MLKVLLPVAALVTTLPAQAQTLDQVVSRHLKAQGSPEAFKALKTLRMTLKMTMGPGMEMPMTITTVFPSKVRTEVTMMGQTSITVLNGKDSWWVQPMMGKTEPEALPESMMTQSEGQARQNLSPLLDYQAKGHKLELVGKAQVEGAEAYHLKLTPKAKQPMDLYLDAETYLVTQIHMTQEMQGQTMDMTVRMGDYRPVAGVLMAHTIETRIKDLPMTPVMKVEKAEPNIAVDEAIFARPAKQPAAAPAQAPVAPATK